MAKVLRIHHVADDYLSNMVREEILFLTRGVACPECVEIVFENSLFRRLAAASKSVNNSLNFREDKVLGFRYRIVSGLGARSGGMAVLIRSEVVFK